MTSDISLSDMPGDDTFDILLSDMPGDDTLDIKKR